MKKEELFETLGNLDEDLIKRSEKKGPSVKTRNGRRNRFVKWGSMVAGCALIISAGFLIPGNSEDEPEAPEPIGIVADHEKNSQDKISEKYVAIDSLLAPSESTAAKESQKACTVQVSQYKAVYEAVASVPGMDLKESIGKAIDSEENAYYVSGHKNLQYIIKDNAETGTYLLWKFMYFDSEEYPYKDVLSMIYDINSASDIEKIVSEPATMDNTDAGKALQKEIGTLTFDKKEQIEKIYHIISGLVCYGTDHWDMIGLEQASMLNQVKAGRYLTLVTSQGMEIDTLKYTAVTGTFYQSGGVVYNPLEDYNKLQIEELLKIESVDEKNVGKGNETDSHVAINQGTDAPVDEADYNDARDYSNDIMDLQNRISQAMVNGELPFVSTSAIYENPDRLHIVVTTDEEEALNKLKAFDTTGKLLDIQYQENGAVYLE